ncbi:glycosyltransferase family 4 protein [uncultured Methanobacterium sp.]|uniref:glycosyltransferase family 4 protein n=1 Tax=uncultured Methanobacterium sp. TaxID=176306 RepID=UPI002AA7B13A|nr:glycosyltransferase family 4 protein [uncultured Methanobacterium sp.]
MKIAVFHNLPSGGAKRALYNHVNYLAKHHEVDVFVPSTANEDYLPLKNIADDIKIFPVKNTRIGILLSSLKYYFHDQISLIDLEKTQKQMADNINSGDYDIVFCEQDQFIVSPFILKYLKKPSIYYCQQPINFRNEIIKILFETAGIKYKNVFGNIHLKLYGRRMVNFDREYMGYSKYTLANSYFSRELILHSYGINSFVSHLGLDTTLFKQIDVPKENFVLSVGQCVPEKGFDFIIKSLSEIDQSQRPEFVIVSDQGNDLWRNYLKDLARKLGVKLKILTMINDDELVTLYNKAKLLVYAPYLEPFGLVPLEAMCCGTPIVAIREGGVRESLIHNKNGILIERDEKLFAKAILDLISDDDMAFKFTKNSKKIVKNYWTLNHSGERLLNHMKRAMEN